LFCIWINVEWDKNMTYYVAQYVNSWKHLSFVSKILLTTDFMLVFRKIV